MDLSKINFNIIGIDEAGRGCIAGSLFVTAVYIEKEFIEKFKYLDKIKDSKKLTEKERFFLYKEIEKTSGIYYKIKKITPQEIDQSNILRVTLEAMKEVALSLLNTIYKKNKSKENFLIYVDGNKAFNLKNYIVKPIIKGDSKILQISLASIISKVNKDKESIELHKLYPNYNFKKHKGYATKEHLSLIQKNGIIKGIYRETYFPVKELNFSKKYFYFKEKILNGENQESILFEINFSELSIDEKQALNTLIKKKFS